MRNIGIWLIRIALLLLLAGLFFGHLASESYRITEPKSGVMGFLSLRPLHVSSAYLGIITAGLGFFNFNYSEKKNFTVWYLSTIPSFYAMDNCFNWDFL
jgi:nitric oxide reductase subunit B